MNFATPLAHNSGRATPSLRCTPKAHHTKEPTPAGIHLSQARSCSDNRSQLSIVGWRGTLRSLESAARAADRETQRRRKIALKNQVVASAAEAVATWEQY